MLNIQDVSYLPDDEQDAYARFIEAVQQSEWPTGQYIGMKLAAMHDETLLTSKVGGVPFLKSFDDVPVDVNGDPMVLLAQINMSELPNGQTLFPVNRGMLQFWISSQNNMYGVSLDQLNNNPNSQLIYVEDTETALSFEEIREYVESSDYDEFHVPVKGAFSIEFTLSEQMVSLYDYRGVECFLPLWNKVNPSFYLEDIYDDYDELIYELYRTFSNTPAHQLGGYPSFTQEDPRIVDDTLQDYDSLVLQLDSVKDGSAEIVWGDMGIGNLFLKHEDLSAMKFDDYLYNWDCT